MIFPLLSAELRKFCETTSVRGVSRIIKSKSTVLFVIWLLGVLSCAGLLIWQLFLVFKKYTSFPVNTLIGQAPDWQNATFPDISICHLCPLVHEREMNVLYTDYLSKVDENLTADNLRKILQTYNMSMDYYDYKNYRRFLESPTAYFNNFPIINAYLAKDPILPILDYSYFNWNYLKNNNFQNDFALNVQRTWDPEYYTCYRIKLAESERKHVRGFTTILYVDDYLDSLWMDYGLDLTNSRSTGMRVMIHQPGTLPNMKLGMSIAPGMETTITLTQTALIHLSAPYSNCTSQEIIGNSTDNTTYTVDYCVDVCLQEQYLKECKCLTSSLQFTVEQLVKANHTICGNLGVTEMNSSIDWGGFAKYVCADELELDCTACQAECLTPCQEIKYSTSVTQAPWPHISAQLSFWYVYIRNASRFDDRFLEYEDVLDLALINKSVAQALLKKLNDRGLIRDNFLQLSVRFDSQTYMEQKDVAAVSIDALGAQIGGVLSLWLGVSAMLIFELCEFFYNLLVTCYCGTRKQSEGSLEICSSKL